MHIYLGDKSVNSYTPNHRIPLTDLGQTQALNAGERLVDLLEPTDNVLFYTSPYKRTIQTTEGIIKAMKKSNVPYRIHEEPRLREQDFGNFQGGTDEMSKVWKERAHYGHFFYRIPNGESAADVYDRVSGFNETLFRQFNTDKFPSVLVLVSHGIWCRVFLMKWFRWSYEKFENFRNLGHCEFLIMEKEEASLKYALLTPLRTWSDPPDRLLTPARLERNESNKHIKSLRFKNLRVWDETSGDRQKAKDELIKQAFESAKKAEAEGNEDDANTDQSTIQSLFQRSDKKTASENLPDIITNHNMIVDEADGTDFECSTSPQELTHDKGSTTLPIISKTISSSTELEEVLSTADREFIMERVTCKIKREESVRNLQELGHAITNGK